MLGNWATLVKCFGKIVGGHIENGLGVLFQEHSGWPHSKRSQGIVLYCFWKIVGGQVENGG